MTDVPHNTPGVDLELYRKDAKTRRELAWELLKETRNPEYVALRYGYPIEKMRQALERIPPDSGKKPPRSNSARDAHAIVKRARDLLPDVTREPGEDDDKE